MHLSTIDIVLYLNAFCITTFILLVVSTYFQYKFHKTMVAGIQAYVIGFKAVFVTTWAVKQLGSGTIGHLLTNASNSKTSLQLL